MEKILNFNHEFYKNSIKINKEIKKFNLINIKFPRYNFIKFGENYFYRVLKEIDNAKDFIFINTYTFENNYISNLILKKLSFASERGVIVNLIADDLQSNLNYDLKNQLCKWGGNIFLTNDDFKIFNRQFFKRQHQKIVLIDNKVILGSSNIGSDYAGNQYGNIFFRDLNVLIKNKCINDAINLFELLALKFKFRYHKIFSNEELFDLYRKKYPDTKFDFDKNDDSNLLISFHGIIRENQDFILNNFNTSKKSIKIITPYYYNIKKIENSLINASKRGVDVEIITSKNKDILCYKNFNNSYLFRKLLKNDIKIYEYTDKYLHAKSFLFDDKTVSIGSFNLDKWSVKGNNELNFKTNNEKAIDDFKLKYQDIKNNSQIVLPKKINLSLTDRFWELFLFISHKLALYGDRIKYLKNNKKESKED